jgi:hypothetical protein
MTANGAWLATSAKASPSPVSMGLCADVLAFSNLPISIPIASRSVMVAQAALLLACLLALLPKPLGVMQVEPASGSADRAGHRRRGGDTPNKFVLGRAAARAASPAEGAS